MGEQIYRRLSEEFVEDVLEAFNDHRIGEEKTCGILGLRRAQFYKLRGEMGKTCYMGKAF
jgi:hypothetical protein